MLAIVACLLDAPDPLDRSLQMELFNMLVNPAKSDFALSWHRDDCKPSTSSEEEHRILTEESAKLTGVQFNTALYTDECLVVVPRSHRRARTPEERRITIDDPLSSNMPGAQTVVLKPGQTLFYNHQILHRGVYDSRATRRTLHGLWGLSESCGGGAKRSRNILQHGMEWIKEARFGDTLPDYMKPMWHNLIDTSRANEGKPIEYSLDG